MSRPGKPRNHGPALHSYPDMWPQDTYTSYVGNVYRMAGDAMMRPEVIVDLCVLAPEPWLSFGIDR